MVGFAVIGADHLHLFTIVEGLVAAGAVPVAHSPDGDLVNAYAGWQSSSQVRTTEEILTADDVDVVVLVGVPAERARVAIAGIEAGKAVVSAKPGVTSRGELERLRNATAGRPGRPWTVLFTERFENRATARAVAMARSGAIGRVVQVIGSGPHTMSADARPDWFFDPARSGGILVDLASHQADQFLALCGDASPDGGVRVTSSMVGNVAHPDHPSVQDIGTMTLVGPGAVGDHRVDLLSPAGLGTWGDVRLTIIGTTGTLEVRANIDVTGSPGAEHLIHVDADGARRIDVADDPIAWAELLLADIADHGERLMTQDHVFAVCDLTLSAQEQAEPWGRS